VSSVESRKLPSRWLTKLRYPIDGDCRWVGCSERLGRQAAHPTVSEHGFETMSLHFSQSATIMLGLTTMRSRLAVPTEGYSLGACGSYYHQRDRSSLTRWLCPEISDLMLDVRSRFSMASFGQALYLDMIQTNSTV
jgi:hypothetical protein